MMIHPKTISGFNSHCHPEDQFNKSDREKDMALESPKTPVAAAFHLSERFSNASPKSPTEPKISGYKQKNHCDLILDSRATDTKMKIESFRQRHKLSIAIPEFSYNQKVQDLRPTFDTKPLSPNILRFGAPSSFCSAIKMINLVIIAKRTNQEPPKFQIEDSATHETKKS